MSVYKPRGMSYTQTLGPEEEEWRIVVIALLHKQH